MTVAEALKRFRAEQKLSQKEVAEKLGMLSQSYYRYETGQFQPRANDIITLAKAYNVSADYLLGLSNTSNPSKVNEAFFNKVATISSELQAILTAEEQCRDSI